MKNCRSCSAGVAWDRIVVHSRGAKDARMVFRKPS
jgi:hypothetical protein